MTTVAEVSAKGFWRDFVCMHYDMTEHSRLAAMRGEN